MPVHLHMVYGCFHAAMAELSITTETTSSINPKIFTIQTLTEKVC